MTGTETASAILTIDLGAVADNWRLLDERTRGAECGAVIKADAYGLGMDPVARTLAAAGCRSFFVALTDEATALRRILPNAAIYVMNGILPGEEALYAEQALIPVLNSPDQIALWQRAAATAGRRLPAALHLDTGMSRLGLTPDEACTLAADTAPLAGFDLACIMSHLATPEDPENADNARQLALFDSLRGALPAARASIAASSAIFLDARYHLDIARPGAAIYGLTPLIQSVNPMNQTIELQGKILQVRAVDRDSAVGYGATHRMTRAGRIATVAAGYADGYLRSLSNRGGGYFGDVRAPVVGRVSMDLITLDVTDVPETVAYPGAMVELIGPHHSVDALAEEAGTIGYEILTALGRRYHRRYVGGTT